MTDYNSSYFGRLLIALSQLGNAISGGNPSVSISARVGYKDRKNLYWKIINWIIDTTFYPVDGENHCAEAYWADSKEDYHIDKGGIFGIVLMTIIVCILCLFLSVILWGYWLIKYLANKTS